MMMHTFFDSMDKHYSTYIDYIPTNWKEEVCKGFAFGFTISTVLTFDPMCGLAAGMLSALATLIHTLITPFFKMIIKEERLLNYPEEILRGSLSIICATALAGIFIKTLLIESIFLNIFIYGTRVVIQNEVLCNPNKANFITTL